MITDVGVVLVSNLVFYVQSTIVVISGRRCITAGAKQIWCDVVLKVITGSLNLSHLFSQCIFLSIAVTVLVLVIVGVRSQVEVTY